MIVEMSWGDFAVEAPRERFASGGRSVVRQAGSGSYIQRSIRNRENEGKTDNLGWMLYSVHAVLSACCTWCMLYWVYAVLGVNS